MLNILSTEADVHGAQKVLSNNGFRIANCFCCLSQNATVCLAHCRQELQQKSWKTARLFLQDWDQDQMFKTKTKTSWSKTKTFIFVLEAPRDQDPGLEDYITYWPEAWAVAIALLATIIIKSIVCRLTSKSAMTFQYHPESDRSVLFCDDLAGSLFQLVPGFRPGDIFVCRHKAWCAETAVSSRAISPNSDVRLLDTSSMTNNSKLHWRVKPSLGGLQNFPLDTCFKLKRWMALLKTTKQCQNFCFLSSISAVSQIYEWFALKVWVSERVIV